MSAFARKQLEKYGWKEGEGLGRNKDGLSTYIRSSRHNRTTHNRDEKGASYAGIGHESTQGGGRSTAEKANELDSVFAEIAAQRKKKEKEERRRQREEQEEEAEAEVAVAAEKDEDEFEEVAVEKPAKKAAKEKPQQQDAKNRSRSASPKIGAAAAPPAKKKPAVVAASSSSDDDELAGGDMSKMTDAQLFAACGGVRLGRSGRHRFFDHKLKRIEESNKKT